MFLLMPGMSVFFFYVTLAVLPAVLLLIYLYRQDRIEKEPMGLLLSLLLMGVLAGFLSMILETIGTAALDMSGLSADSPLYTILLAFLVVAAVEEGTKYFLMHLRVWKNPNFNYRFDGIVYAVFTSLGFAAIENIIYAMGYGPSVLISRALLSIPGHMSFGVLFGISYGRARMYANRGEQDKVRPMILKGYLLAVLVQGLYDACAMLGTVGSLLIFAVVVIAIYVVIFRIMRKEARTDVEIIPQNNGFPPQNSGYPTQGSGYPTQNGSSPQEGSGMPDERFRPLYGEFHPQNSESSPQDGSVPPQDGFR